MWKLANNRLTNYPVGTVVLSKEVLSLFYNRCYDLYEEIVNDDFMNKETDGTPLTTNPSFWGGTVPWLASAEIDQERTTRTTTGLQNSSAKIAPKNSVLIALAGPGKTKCITIRNGGYRDDYR